MNIFPSVLVASVVVKSKLSYVAEIVFIAGSIVQRSSKTGSFSKSFFFSTSALFHAIERQDIDEVRKLITTADININEYIITFS